MQTINTKHTKKDCLDGFLHHAIYEKMSSDEEPGAGSGNNDPENRTKCVSVSIFLRTLADALKLNLIMYTIRSQHLPIIHTNNKELGVQLHRTTLTAYHPQSNGLVERFHIPLKTSFK